MAALADVDLFTPWKDQAAVEARHVGRSEELAALDGAIRSFARGGSPLPIYLFGPRGCGKSHLLALTELRRRDEMRTAGTRLLPVPEETPEFGQAERLLARCLLGPPSFGKSHPAPPGNGPRTVLLWEGVDRYLTALGREQRRVLRRLLAERPWIYVIGTGAALGTPLVGEDEAFRGHFEARPVRPLADGDAAALIDRICAAPPPDSEAGARWARRRRTLLMLAGGGPRALAMLAIAAARRPEAPATDDLAAVLREITPHYQGRFRDLSRQEQEIVDLLARAPGAVGASQIAGLLDTTPPTIANTCGRLEEAGYLRATKVDRHTFFEIHEPMFRFWIEYRTADWSDTRIAWLTRDLEWLWTPAEVARAWLGDHEPDAQIAAERVVRRNPASARVVVDVATEELRAALRGGERFKTAALWARIASLDAGPAALLELATRFLSDGETHFLPDRTDGLNPQARLVYRAIQRLGASSGGRRSEGPKASTVSLALAARRGAEVDLALPDAIGDAVIRAIERVDPRGGQWKLSESDRRALAGAPWLRVNFLRRGRVWSHPALLTSADVLPHLRKRDGDLGALLTIAHAWEDVGLFTVSAIRLAEGEGLLPW